MLSYRAPWYWLTALVICLAAAWPTPASARHGQLPADKPGILLVAFGTSVPEARVAYDAIGQRVAQDFPTVETRWAYTSGVIRRKMARQGERLDSPALALARMLDDGFTRVAVQPLHVVPGQEYHDLVRTVAAFRQLPEGFACLTLGDPLLSSPEELPAAAALLKRAAPKISSGQAVVFMGHGTAHPANAFYPALQHYLGENSTDPIVGTVDGSPDLESVLARLKARRVKTVWLLPLMAVAGDHARNDLAGSEPDSWKSIMEKEGYQARPILKGLAEYPEIAGLWLNHLRKAVAALDNARPSAAETSAHQAAPQPAAVEAAH